MIKISNLSKSFSGQTVLDHLNLDIQKGEVVALIGSSGAGKSTFLKAVPPIETKAELHRHLHRLKIRCPSRLLHQSVIRQKKKARNLRPTFRSNPNQIYFGLTPYY